MKVYISGKITGLEHMAAFRKFALSETILVQNGFFPVNPMQLVIKSDGKSWSDYMAADIKLLLECDAIFMQSDWGDSKGARVEYAISKELGINIMFETDYK